MAQTALLADIVLNEPNCRSMIALNSAIEVLCMRPLPISRIDGAMELHAGAANR